MESERFDAIARLIAGATGDRGISIVGTRSIGGGCTHVAEIVTAADGRNYFVKSNLRAEDMFVQEAFSLAALKRVGVIRVPQVIAVGMLDDVDAALVLEAIEEGEPAANFWYEFGSSFAHFHQQGSLPIEDYTPGWPTANYIGWARQFNDSTEGWAEFFATKRIGFQLGRAQCERQGTVELFELADRLIGRLPELLDAEREPLVLLHGDLWNGNYLVDNSGKPVLIDPASYYGHREADLAMPLLFGGFPPSFFEGYQECWPLQDGWRDRVEIYKLYHLLNHLVLFGSSYLEGCLAILRRFA